MHFEDFCHKTHQGGDKEKADVARARNALEAEQEEERILPTFIPSTQASEMSEFGHQVYVKAGLLSEAELVTHTGKGSKELGLSPFAVDWQGPNSQVGSGSGV